MQKSLITVVLFVLLVSFAPGKTSRSSFFKHIDITFVSPEGCLFHVVGDATINIFKLKLTHFVGTITMSGPAGCPRGTYQISYSSFQIDGENGNWNHNDGVMRMEFNTDDLCAISKVNFITMDGSRDTQFACESVNSKTELKASLIEELKEGSCK